MKTSISAMVVFGATLIGGSSTFAQQATTKDQVVGNWKLLAAYSRNIDTGKTTDRYGENPRGQMIITGDGRIALTFVSRSRKAPTNSAATDAEAAQLWRTLFSYVGTIQFDPTPTEAGLKIVIRSEVSSSPASEGVDRMFFVKREGNKLTSTSSPPARDPATGQATTAVTVYEREP
jgi:Lipocalin-like domain